MDRRKAHDWQVTCDVKSDEHRRRRKAEEARTKALMFAWCMSKQMADCPTSTFTSYGGEVSPQGVSRKDTSERVQVAPSTCACSPETPVHVNDGGHGKCVRAKSMYESCVSDQECSYGNPNVQCVDFLCYCPLPFEITDSQRCLPPVAIHNNLVFAIGPTGIMALALLMLGGVYTYQKKSISQVQLDTVSYCGDNHEVVSVRLKLESVIVDVINVYIRPEVNENDFSWLRRRVDTRTPTVVAGDFNAMHTAWGFSPHESLGFETVGSNDVQEKENPHTFHKERSASTSTGNVRDAASTCTSKRRKSPTRVDHKTEPSLSLRRAVEDRGKHGSGHSWVTRCGARYVDDKTRRASIQMYDSFSAKLWTCPVSRRQPSQRGSRHIRESGRGRLPPVLEETTIHIRQKDGTSSVHLERKHFKDDDHVIAEVERFLNTQNQEF
ncbi:hypothetical protein HPB47_014352 [Ixodes persulcatus]|uniref:Uncharacterized protein n=1 Tax=Ixodes persulcatus TaxID=34615 RepID=A0AC60QZU3_IXOPE|nr:hypothetical protein HPB47_014352 [Ixodes persulcatus]